jgi:hypothetical protein
MRWRLHLPTATNNQCQIPKYPHTDLYTTPPPPTTNLKYKLSVAFSKISQIISAQRQRPTPSNLSNIEKATIKTLRQKDFIFLPSDKGGEFCVIGKSRYINLGMEHLNDTSTYRPIPHITAKTIEKRINSVWNDICTRNEISCHLRKAYITNNSAIPTFYHLIKTHKPGPNIKIRPIVSNINGPTHKIAWMLSKVLKPLINHVPAHLENSLQLIQRIQQRTTESKRTISFPCSLDVVSLYTSIPPNEALENIRILIEDHEFECRPLSTNDILKLLKAVLTNTYFTFNDKIFHQISGLAMGSSVSAILAILFMHTLETQALSSIRLQNIQIDCYGRYVDDSYLIVKDLNAADRTLTIFNSINENIKFEIEFPSANNSLSLLDFKVTIGSEGEASFEFYKKAARSSIFMNGKTALPTTTKDHVIQNEKQRIIERCTSTETANEQLKKFHEILKVNEHQANNIRLRPQRRRQTRREINENTFFLPLPFINDQIHYGIRRIFKQLQLDVIPIYRNTNLRSLLNKKNHGICNLQRCPINDPNLCTKKNVVYQIHCMSCNQTYIGSTIRTLHYRVKEHLSQTHSAVYQHLRSCDSNIRVNILATDSDPKVLRIKEGLLISDLNPSLNRREEETCINSLIQTFSTQHSS